MNSWKGRVPKDLDGERLDKAMAALEESLSRGQARKLLQRGAVRVNGKRVRTASRPVRAGNQVEWVNDKRDAERMVHGLEIVEQAADYAVCFKAPGQLVQGTKSSDEGTLERLLNRRLNPKGRAREGGPRARVVHRLDSVAQGLVVLAFTREMAAHLQRQIMDRSLQRIYWALIGGIPTRQKGTIRVSLSSLSDGRVWPYPHGRNAVTHWRLLRSFPGRNLALVECSLETGRTHQIRAHMAEEIFPIAGDWRYGSDLTCPVGLAAVELSFEGLDGNRCVYRREPDLSFFSEHFGS